MDLFGFGVDQVLDMQKIEEEVGNEKVQLAAQWREELPASVRKVVHDSIHQRYKENPHDPTIVTFVRNARDHFRNLKQRDGRKIRTNADRHIASIVYLMTQGKYYSQHDESVKNCEEVLRQLERIEK